MTRDGRIVWSWVLPALAAAVIVNSLLFGGRCRRSWPGRRHAAGRRRLLLCSSPASTRATSAPPPSVQVMPLLVVWRLGACGGRLPDAAVADRVRHHAWCCGTSPPRSWSRRPDRDGQPGALLRRSLLLWAGSWSAAMIVCVPGARPLHRAGRRRSTSRAGRAAAPADRAERPVHRRGRHLRDARLARPAGLAAGRLPGRRRGPAACARPGAAAAAGADAVGWAYLGTQAACWRRRWRRSPCGTFVEPSSEGMQRSRGQ